MPQGLYRQIYKPNRRLKDEKKFTVAYFEKIINEIVVEANNEEEAYEAAEKE